jgi:hypothetical protein
MLAGLQHPRNGGDLVFRLRHFADGPRGTWPSDGQCPPPISAFTRMDGHLAYMSKVNVQGRTLSLAPSPVARDWLRRLPPRPQIGNVPSCGPAHSNWPATTRRTMDTPYRAYSICQEKVGTSTHFRFVARGS